MRPFLLFILTFLLFSCKVNDSQINGIYENSFRGGMGGCMYYFKNNKFKMYESGCVFDAVGHGKAEIIGDTALLKFSVYFGDKGWIFNKIRKLHIERSDSTHYSLEYLRISSDSRREFKKWYRRKKMGAWACFIF